MRPPSHGLAVPVQRRSAPPTVAQRLARELCTPFVEVDEAGTVRRAAALGAALAAALPVGVVRHVVGEAGEDAVLRALAVRGADFEVTTPQEAMAALAAGATCDDLLYTGCVAHHTRVAAAAALGVRLFVVGTIAEVDDVLTAAPGAGVVCRLSLPASRSGVDSAGGGTYAAEVLRHAAECGLDPAGVAVVLPMRAAGRSEAAQQRMLHQAAAVWETLRHNEIRPWLLSVTAHSEAATSESSGSAPEDDGSSFAHELARLLTTAYSDDIPRVSVGTGPWLVQDCATLVASVVSVTWSGSVRRVVLDAAPFVTGQADLPSYAPHVETSADDQQDDEQVASGPCVLLDQGAPWGAGDGHLVRLPLGLQEGDLVRVGGLTGAPKRHGLPVVSA